MDTRYFSRRTAAKYLGVSIRKVDSLLASRSLRKIRLGGRVVLDRVDLDRMMDEHKQ